MTRLGVGSALALLNLCLIIVSAGNLSASPDASWPIVPGRGVGPLYLGMTEEQAKPYLNGARFEAPKRIGIGHFQWAALGLLSFRFDKMQDESNFHLTVVAIDDPKFSTRQGVHVGSPISQVMSAYGTSSSTMVTKEQEQGRIVEPDDPNGLVQCLDTSADFADKGAAVQFFFTYLKQGIVFITHSTPNSSHAVDMTVAEIRVIASQPCRPF